ncbi:MAG: DUF4340 domain-containing protein [Clostridiales bacterium]|nr:DUF4340 domain-containing protein [Clostridiales bacterium]
MKRHKRIYLLLGVLAVICIATIIVRGIEEKKEKIKNSDKIILQVPSDLVKTLSWEYKSNSLSFHKDGKWIYDKDEAFPVSEKKIKEFLQQFENFGVTFIIEDVEDYGQYGLDKPICTIKFSTEEKSYEVKLGDFSTMDSQRYVSIGDGNVYLVKNDPLEYFNATLSEMINHDTTPIFTKVSVKEIKFTGAEDYNIIYEKDSVHTYNKEDIYFAQQSGKKLPLDTTKVNDYLNSISYLNLTDYVSYNATADELKKCGLDSPELKITVNYSSENEEGKESSDTFVLNVSRDPEQKKAAKDSDDKNKDDSEKEDIIAYARVGESKIIYKIPSDSYKKLMAASYDSLRHSEVLATAFENINKFDITLESKEYTINTEKKDDKRIYTYKDKEIEITDLQNAFSNLKAESFTKNKPTEKEEISLTVYLDDENFPKIKLQFYRYDGSHCIAVVDGESVSLIKRSNVVDLIEAVNAIILN